MAVRRIVATFAAPRLEAARGFYEGILGLDLVMDHGWVMTFAAASMSAAPQISIATEGGSGTPVPDLSVEVDDFEDVLARVAAAGLPLAYGPASEPWGVRRFFVRDPLDRLINVLTHIA